MILHHSSLLLAAAAPPATMEDPKAAMIKMFFTMGFLILGFYLLVLRPQSKKAKEHTAMLKTVKTGDKIVTSGGIVGTVINVRDRTISIRSAETKLEVLISAVAEIKERGGGGESNGTES